MSYARYPAERLKSDAKLNIKFLEDHGLTVKSTTKVPKGILAYHTITDQSGKVLMEEGYTSDLRRFTDGFRAAKGD
jgi:hypothetical protein